MDRWSEVLTVICLFAAVLASPISGQSNGTTTESTGGTTAPGLGLVASAGSCKDVKQIFAMKEIGSVQLVPDAMVKGDENNICPSNFSCCTPKMEDRYKEAVKKDVRSMLQTASSYLKTLIATSSTQFRENFLDMIASSENETLSLFANVYKKLETASKSPVNQLFSSLSSYVRGQEVDLEEAVAVFFDALFPLVYHHTINPKLKDFSEDYKECLRETREEIRPFGDVPQQLSTNLFQSFGTVRAFLQALSLGVEVINTTEHMDFGSDCSKALVRLTYCPHCLGTVTAKPCGPFCLNVVRGCLSQVAELDRPWADFVAALERMTSGVVGSYNAEEVLTTVDTKISEAIMHAMEIGPELSRKAKVACGHPKRDTRDVSSRSGRHPRSSGLLDSSSKNQNDSEVTTESSQHPEESAKSSPGGISKSGVSTRSTAEGSLLQRLQSFARKLSESRSFYGNLADTLCNEDSLATNGDHCWNGHGFGEYTKTIAGIGVTAQKYNPEMRPAKAGVVTSAPSQVASLVDKLSHLKQLLNNRALAVPQSDSYVVEGSGSGSYWDNQVGDDEDYNDGSGSGNGLEGKKQQGSEEDFTFGGKDTKNSKEANPKGNGVNHPNRPSQSLLFFTSTVVLLGALTFQRRSDLRGWFLL